MYVSKCFRAEWIEQLFYESLFNMQWYAEDKSFLSYSTFFKVQQKFI